MSETLFPNYNQPDFVNFSDVFSVRYDIESSNFPNSMDVDDLLVSLSGLSLMLEAIGHKADIKIQLKINATKPGSFVVVCSVVGLVGGTLGILQWFGIDWKVAKNPTVRVLLEIKRILIETIKKAGNSIDDFAHEIIANRGLSENAQQFLIQLRNNAYLCDGIDDFTEPLDSATVQKLEILYEDKPITDIKKEDRKYFRIGTSEQETITTDTINVKIIYPSLEKTEWGFQSSKGEFWANIEDDYFINNIKFQPLSILTENNYEAEVVTKTILKKNAKRSVKRYYIKKIRPVRDLFTDRKNDAKTEE